MNENEDFSFIEKQFPVSKVSKESYKERKANNGQTLTGLGKWWGRKPLILVRAAIIGCLLPCSDDPKADMEIFLKILSMDNDGLLDRKEKKIPAKELYELASRSKHYKQFLNEWFDVDGSKYSVKKDQDKYTIETKLFQTLGYDDKLRYCMRPEELSTLRKESWTAINKHLGTSAQSLPELVEQLSMKRYGHLITVGDCFAGGGSIPFEAARVGATAYASDLNPVAGLLTWADLNILGSTPKEVEEIKIFQKKIFDCVEKEIIDLGVEHNERGDRAVSYVYCVEVMCPECQVKVPLAPSWIIGQGTKTVAILEKNGNQYDISIKMNASKEEMDTAKVGTTGRTGLTCPHCKKITPITSLRKDRTVNKETVYGLRQWEKTDFDFRDDDTYSERLYAIKYEKTEILADGKQRKTRYYAAPSERDLENERKVNEIVADNLDKWQSEGYIPSLPIEDGDKTKEVKRNRGWTFWHHLFNPRQLYTLSLLNKNIAGALSEHNRKLNVTSLLGLNRCMLFNSRLSMWVNGTGVEKTVWIFTNQAYNTFFNYGSSSTLSLKGNWQFSMNCYPLTTEPLGVTLANACDVKQICDFWITDPPYADAVNYHELSEIFLAWDKPMLKRAFPDWYTDSKRILAVKGDETFAKSMIEIYSNLAKHMPVHGMQVVMFTHSDPAVWAQLALIMWKSGLKVTAAWNIATETDASGLKDGNYVKGTVILVLRKQLGDEMAFMDEITTDIRTEVRSQIESMVALENKEEPNFSDPDYVLAAYAASLKVLTSYKEIEDLELMYELDLAINNPKESKIVQVIENAKKIAYDCLIPLDFDSVLWKELSNGERFYIKGLENEKHGSYALSTYQEFARGFNIGGYSQMMASDKANAARLKTPFEMASRKISDVPDFESSILRTICVAIYSGIKEENDPHKALGYLKSEVANYWEKREMIKQLLSFLINTKDIDNMKEHWSASGEMAELLLSVVTHDSI